jgi:cytoskeletal protein CcmA (bactofilin family)
MLGLNRRPDSLDTKPAAKPVLAPPMSATSALTPPGAAPQPRPAPMPEQASAPAAAPRATAGSSAPDAIDPPGSTLSIGVNIKLKGVEISDCDALVVEGQVEATVSSKAMEIAKPGTLTGTATIDVAEIHGHFSGELTARTRLVVHATGRVSGTVRYGKLVVAEGGEINGDVRQLDAATGVSPASSGSAARPGLPGLTPHA